MTISIDKAIKTYGLISHVGGTMGTATRPVSVGKAYVFNVDGYKVVKQVFNSGDTNYKVIGKNITETFYTDTFNINEINSVNAKLRSQILSEIMSSDLGRVVDIMNKNKKSFLYLMEQVQSTQGLSKDLSFAEVVKYYYSHKFDYLSDTKAIVKVMIKYGYEFTCMIEANKLIR